MLWLYCRSWLLTIVTVSCSLCSLIWQFGVLHLIGYGLDPLAVLVPFLVFAIGVSHGVQQINMAGAEIAAGLNKMQAARSEEHTSELQSLMRISSAVFCLKTKTTKHEYEQP